ncbi:glycosyltransferase [Geomonas sp. RF6]|uniref:glycosyltransferase n=1 Tax=Geomonas sp. RF6 TaxID=2897342 RepID=UPI001E604184|nr:glycosyltransferase [Geomonas sp. RF6]UFS69141.1 glycosyltransferase [Geomonas sp. RF6]
MQKNKLLFVTFYYPPAGGVALPGSQRAVKFVRYLEKQSVWVLTVETSCYPPFVSRDFDREVPVKGEKIAFARSYDLFQVLLALRRALRRALGRGRGKVEAQGMAAAGGSEALPRHPRSLAQKVKDFVYDLCHYPDGASGWILPALRAGRSIVRKEKIDLVLASGMPWSALVVAWLLHKVTGVSFAVDFRDPWIGNPFHESKGVLLDALGRYLERRIVHDAALVSANTEPLRDEFLARYPEQPRSKFVVLSNGYDPEDFRTLQPDAETAAESGPDRLVLAHAGFLYGRRDPSPLLEALERLIASDRCQPGEFLFLQIGTVQLDYDFHERYRSLMERGVMRDLGPFPFAECLRELQRSDVLVLIQPNTRTQVPSKLYDYLCLNRPILTITPHDGALGRMVTQHRFGDLFDQTDVAGIADRLLELLEQKKIAGTLRADYHERDFYNVQRIAAVLDDHLIEAARS